MQAKSWEQMEFDQLNDKISRQMESGASCTIARLVFSQGGYVPRHSHVNEQVSLVLEGCLRFIFDDGEKLVRAGEVLIIPSNVPHAAEAIEDCIDIDFFTPRREDWIRKEDAYLRTGQPAPKR